MDDAPQTRSNSIDASVGAAGMNERKRGWSTEMQAGASTSPNSFSAAAPPMPSAVMVWPARPASSLLDLGPSSGTGSIRRRCVVYSRMALASSSV